MSIRNVPIIIIARPTSSRLPNKHNLKIGDLTLMEWVIRNAKAVSDVVVIATTKGGSSYYESYGLPIYSFQDLDDSNVCGRIRRVLNMLDSEIVITMLGDCPLIDSNLVVDMYRVLKSCDADYVFVPGKHNHVGIEVFRRERMLDINDGEHLSIEIGKHTPVNTYLHLEDVEFKASIDTQIDLDFMNTCHSMVNKFNYYNVLHLLSKGIDNEK